LAWVTDGEIRAVAGEDIAALVKARSMLLILLSTCETTLVALDAAGNALDIDMTEDLRRMIERTKVELAAADEKIEAFRK
jgi:hypothetical protein